MDFNCFHASKDFNLCALVNIIVFALRTLLQIGYLTYFELSDCMLC